MGEGLRTYLNTAVSRPEWMTQKTYDTSFRLIMRTVTAPKNHGSEAMTDWMAALGVLMSFRREGWQRASKLKEVLEFTGGSFSMTTLPERRKGALMMMEGLLGVANVLTKSVVVVGLKTGPPQYPVLQQRHQPADTPHHLQHPQPPPHLPA